MLITFQITVGIILGSLVVIGVDSFLLRRKKKPKEKKLATKLDAFFDGKLQELTVISRTFTTMDLPNIDLAVNQYCKDLKIKPEIIGYVARYAQNNLSELIRDDSYSPVTLGPVQYREVDISTDKSVHCVKNGIYLIHTSKEKIAVHIFLERNYEKNLELEVMASSKEIATKFIEDVRHIAQKQNVYRYKIMSLDGSTTGDIRFHNFPKINHEEIILPQKTMDLVERNTKRFFENINALRKSQRSLKRGILFHGKPGTGKTYTAKWLAKFIKNITVFVVTGGELHHIRSYCNLARILAPSLVIMEDVDLIAKKRHQEKYQLTLHELLNEMDGISSEAEVIFILTTNRPEDIEPALAGRPGRIDQAIEFPLPDASCRKKLIELYGQGLLLNLNKIKYFVEKTEGASPAFIKELVRKSSLIAAEENSIKDDVLCVTDNHFELALSELVLGGGELTKNLLGFK